MSLRVKTIEYVFPTNFTPTASAAAYTTALSPIYIAETGITFKSCSMEAILCGTNTTQANMTVPILGIKVGASAANTVTLPNPHAQATQNESWILNRDVTAQFTASFTGNTTQQLVQCTTNVTGIVTVNQSIKLFITYQYDDGMFQYQSKTIRIPIESTRSLLTTSWQTVGGAKAIPPLTNAGSTFFYPETGVTVRQVWMELWSNEGTNATGQQFLAQSRLNGATTPINLWWTTLTSLNVARWQKSIVDLTANPIITGSTYVSLECLSSGQTSRYSTMGGMICSTYEFDAYNSTNIYNSLILGGVDSAGSMAGSGATDQSSWDRTIYIEEPYPITLKESAACIFCNDSGTFNAIVAVGGQSDTTYTQTAGNIQAGQYSFVHRIDSGGTAGVQGINTFLRGKNTYSIRYRSSVAQAGWNTNGFMILNYISGKYSGGVGAHAHSIYQHVMNPVTATQIQINSPAIQPFIPESKYYLIGYVTYLPSVIKNSTDQAFTYSVETLGGESVAGSGWTMLYNGQARMDNKNGIMTMWGAARNTWERWVGDPDPDRINFLLYRKYKLDSDPVNYTSLAHWYTYGNIMYTVSGVCSGFSSDGSGIPVYIHRLASTSPNYYEPILNLTTIAGGSFTGQWIDNTDTLFAEARQDDTHVGRSANTNAA